MLVTSRYAPIDVDELKRCDLSNRNMVSSLDGVKAESRNWGMSRSVLVAALTIAVFAVRLRMVSEVH